MSIRDLSQLRQLLSSEPGLFGRVLPAELIEQSVQYYALVLKWNPRLNLTTLTSPEEFMQRHLTEAAFLTDHLSPTAAHVYDLGSGLGVPGIPLALLRPALPVALVEANHRKAVFLEEVVYQLRLENVRVLPCRLEAVGTPPENTVLSARAIDKMTSLLPLILKLGVTALQVLLLGGAELVQLLAQNVPGSYQFQHTQLPGSAARYLLELRRFT